MCRPIRSLTEAKGYSASSHTWVQPVNASYYINITPRLATFGGAGGQHACEIARLLGIDNVLIHRYSSILSAYGLALADRLVLFPSSAGLLTGSLEYMKFKSRPPQFIQRTLILR